jgi:hypothetical protein
MTPKTGAERKQEFLRRQQQRELAKPDLAVARKQGQRALKEKSRAKQQKLTMSSPQSTPKKPSALDAAAAASPLMSHFANQAIMLARVDSNQKERAGMMHKERAGIADLQRQELSFMDRLQTSSQRLLGINTDIPGPPPSSRLLLEIDEVPSEEEEEVSKESISPPPPGNVGDAVAARKVGVAGAPSVGVAAPPSVGLEPPLSGRRLLTHQLPLLLCSCPSC